MIEINGVKYIPHYLWVYGSSNCSCGYPVLSYLERVDDE